jgi:hypothetical protein
MGEYRSFTMELQEQFVITIGASMMHESCVDSLASPMEQHIKALTMDQGRGEFRYLFNTKHILIVKLKLSYFQINDEFYYSSSISDTFSRTCDSSIGQMLTTIRLDITPSTTRTFQKI